MSNIRALYANRGSFCESELVHYMRFEKSPNIISKAKVEKNTRSKINANIFGYVNITH